MTQKLIPNLMDKSHYVVHYLNLKLYLQLGMKVTTIHGVLEFPKRRGFVPTSTDVQR